jgi:hypothetical protein
LRVCGPRPPGRSGQLRFALANMACLEFAELSDLSNQQAKALADAIFVGMTAEEALDYDNRHARILEILRGDGQVWRG